MRVLIRFENMTTKPSSCKLSNDQCPTTSEPIKAHILIHEGMNASGMTICPSRNAKCGKSNTGCLPHTHTHICVCVHVSLCMYTHDVLQNVCLYAYVCVYVSTKNVKHWPQAHHISPSVYVQQPRKSVLAWQEKAYVCMYACICARVWAGEGVCM